MQVLYVHCMHGHTHTHIHTYRLHFSTGIQADLAFYVRTLLILIHAHQKQTDQEHACEVNTYKWYPTGP